MLVLSRKPGESIRIGNDIVVTLTEVRGGRVKIGISAPDSCTIRRGELEDWNAATAPLAGEAAEPQAANATKASKQSTRRQQASGSRQAAGTAKPVGQNRVRVSLGLPVNQLVVH